MKKILCLLLISAVGAALTAQAEPKPTPEIPKPAEAPAKPATEKPAIPETKPVTTETKPAESKPAAPETKPAIPEAKPPVTETKPLPPADPTTVKPVTDPAKPVAEPAKPVAEPAKPAEPEMDPETKRLIEEAKQKILREKAEKEAAEKKAKEDAARKAEEEKTFFGTIKANSKLYTGLSGGLGLSLNKVHGTGIGFGGLVDYTLFKHYGIHAGFLTGQLPTQSINLISGNSTIPIVTGGTLGFVAIDGGLYYAFPQLFGIESTLGAGLAYYSVYGGNYEFGKMLAPKIAASFYYNLPWGLQVGVIWDILLASASKITNNGTEYKLDSSASMTTMGLQLAIRYNWF